jgi:hypothetical protein
VKLNPQLARSGVTPIEPESKPGSNKTAPTKSSSGSQPAGGKLSSSGSQPAGGKLSNSAYPVPVQMPFEHNETKSSPSPASNTEMSLPQPPAFGACGGKAGSQPSTPNDEHQPVFGTQESREETPFDPAEEELLENFPKPKPGILDLSVYIYSFILTTDI